MPLDMPLLQSDFEANLLPSTSATTKYMRAIEGAARNPDEMWQLAEKVGDVKVDLLDATLAFMIFELGLEPLTPYITDKRTLIRDGRDWQRIRGTPAAIIQALRWVNFIPLLIEESPDDSWWDLFQLAFPEGATDLQALDNIIALTRLSKAAHTDVIRLYTPSHDIRALKFNHGTVNGAFYINDWSGIWVRPDWPKVSFGRTLIDLSEHNTETDADGFVHAEMIALFERVFGFTVNADLVNGPELIDTNFSHAAWLDANHGDLSDFSGGGPWPLGAWPIGPYTTIAFESEPVVSSGIYSAGADLTDPFADPDAWGYVFEDMHDTSEHVDPEIGTGFLLLEMIGEPDLSNVINGGWPNAEWLDDHYGVTLAFDNLGWVETETP